MISGRFVTDHGIEVGAVVPVVLTDDVSGWVAEMLFEITSIEGAEVSVRVVTPWDDWVHPR